MYRTTDQPSTRWENTNFSEWIDCEIKVELYWCIEIRLRAWFFTSSDGKFSDKLLAEISRDNDPVIETQKLDVDVEKPATLILNNVDMTYNGTYTFYLTPVGVSTVNVFIAGKLKWTRITGFFKIAYHFIFL